MPPKKTEHKPLTLQEVIDALKRRRDFVSLEAIRYLIHIVPS